MKTVAIAASIAVFLGGAALAAEPTSDTQKKSSSAATPATPSQGAGIGATPATPSQGAGSGATPATPSTKASDKALETPSRSKETTPK